MELHVLKEMATLPDITKKEERVEKILVKNIKMVKVGPKYHIVHRVLRNQSSMPWFQPINVVYSVVNREAWQCIG